MDYNYNDSKDPELRFLANVFGLTAATSLGIQTPLMTRQTWPKEKEEYVVRERFLEHWDEIQEHMNHYQGIVNQFTKISSALLNENAPEAAIETMDVADRVREYGEFVEAHRDKAKIILFEPFVYHPTLEFITYINPQEIMGQCIGPFGFNPEQSHEGLKKELQNLEAVAEDFSNVDYTHDIQNGKHLNHFNPSRIYQATQTTMENVRRQL